METAYLNNSQDVYQSLPIHRFSMAYRPFVQRTGPVKLNKTLIVRRIILFALVLSSMWFAGGMISTILSPEGLTPLKWVIICIFMVLFGWISLTFWTSLMGFVALLRGHRDSIVTEGPLHAEVAIVIPIYNEDIDRVFASVQTMHESLRQTGQLEHFSFFVLSDTDQPQQCEQEEIAWMKLHQKLGKVFYRRRKSRTHKKSGNISDFCRRWGSQFKYMIPLDADSLMSGPSMVKMVRTMEASDDIGILQTVPKGINQQSLISRINQFSSYVYGPLLMAGSQFWQLDDAGFWGHNAIVRLEPFMKFCALPKLSGPLPFGGEILSHDSIEAALMRRAGWGVWLANEIDDSYEELPPDLLKELERDCRWCRGNIQHLRLMFMRGISFGHRFLFFNGNMFYFSAFWWLVLLVLMTVYAIINFFHKPQYFSAERSLFPHWPIQYSHLSIDLLIATIIFLFLPKILSIAWITVSHQGYLFGGAKRLTLSVFLEIIFSVFLAPIRMLFHSWFVLTSLLGRKFDWKRQTRHLQGTSFSEALKAHGAGSLIALCWALITFEVNQTLFLWLCVVVVPLFLAIPISMLMSYRQVGAFFKKLGFFLTPVEIDPPNEILHFNKLCK